MKSVAQYVKHMNIHDLITKHRFLQSAVSSRLGSAVKILSDPWRKGPSCFSLCLPPIGILFQV